jgi:hypothetical protein
VIIPQVGAGETVESFLATVAALITQGGVGCIITDATVAAFNATSDIVGIDQYLADGNTTIAILVLLPSVVDMVLESSRASLSSGSGHRLEYEAPLQLVDISDEFVPS